MITRLENQRDYRAAIPYAQRLVEQDPLREESYRDLMRLYALNGDRAGALRTYHALAATLQRELEIAPSPATQQVYERILKMGPLPLPPADPRLIGRDREWAELQAAWQRADEEEPVWVSITGAEGVGKTRLAEELLQWAGRQGIATASTRCYAHGRGLAFAPLARLLRARPLPPLDQLWLVELARLLPEILIQNPYLPAPDALTEGWRRARFFEAIARALLATQPVLLLIDDVHYSDPETIEFLQYLLNFDRKARLLLVTTAQREAFAADDPLESLLSDVRRHGQLLELELQPLTEAETARLAAATVGHELDPALARSIYHETQGNPFFVLELARSGLERSAQHSIYPQDLRPANSAGL